MWNYKYITCNHHQLCPLNNKMLHRHRESQRFEFLAILDAMVEFWFLAWHDHIEMSHDFGLTCSGIPFRPYLHVFPMNSDIALTPCWLSYEDFRYQIIDFHLTEYFNVHLFFSSAFVLNVKFKIAAGWVDNPTTTLVICYFVIVFEASSGVVWIWHKSVARLIFIISIP